MLSALPHSSTTQKRNVADHIPNYKVGILKPSALARTQRLKGAEKM